MTANEAMERSKDPRRKVESVGDEEAIEALVAEIERLRELLKRGVVFYQHTLPPVLPSMQDDLDDWYEEARKALNHD